MKLKKNITILISLLTIILSSSSVFASDEGFKQALPCESKISNLNQQSEQDFWKEILDKGTIVENKNDKLIEYNNIYYSYDFAVKKATDLKLKTASFGYYLANDNIYYNYLSTKDILSTPVFAHIGETVFFTMSQDLSYSASASAGASVADVLSVSGSVGFAKTYRNSSTISKPITSYGRYALLGVFNVHTFDIYCKPILGSEYKVGIGVYYEPTGVTISTIN